MARQAGLKNTKAMFRTVYIGNMADLERFAKLVAEHEREACAKRLDAVGCDHCAANIRLRGKE
jgi:hypothetical protein